MRKIKYKQGRKLQPHHIEYTGCHKQQESEIQLFVYDNSHLIDYKDFKVLELENLLIMKIQIGLTFMV
jgi:magnesium transporter